MALNPQFFPAPSLQELFRDKTTGLPLSFGLVFFYSDVNRTVLKPIYTLSGSPPNYTYTQLPNPVILSGIGSIQDGAGNDVLPYYFPFDANGNVENYYIIVYDQFGIQQFTRQAYPNETGNISPSNLFTSSSNPIPNGQFLLNNPPASYPQTEFTFDYGALGIMKVIDVAPGGWEVVRNNASTTPLTVTFDQFLTEETNPSSSPRYQIEIKRTIGVIPSADSVCDLRIRFMDVNKFQNNSLTNTWTLIFTGESVGGTLLNCSIRLIKYFGSGGSPSASTDIPWIASTFAMPSASTVLAFAGSFGINNGKTTGTNNDDFLELAIRFPSSLSQTFDVKLTDFMLFPGTITSSQAANIPFPATTNGQFILQALSNVAPGKNTFSNNYYQEDGSNLYLPMVMTKSGFTYDESQIGKIYFSGIDGAVSPGELLCDGARYLTSAYSSDGIPYARLQKKLFSSVTGTNKYGNGVDYVNAYLCNGNNTFFHIITNKPGVQTNPADGTIPTTFTFNTTVNAGTAGFPFRAFTNPIGLVTSLSNFTAVPFSVPATGTSGMTVLNMTPVNVAGIMHAFTVQSIAAAALSTGLGNPGKYFLFSSNTTDYYMWFNVVGEIDPAVPGKIAVECNLNSTWSAIDVGYYIASVLNGFQTNTVAGIAAAGLTPGSYFTFFSNGDKYTVWFEVAGAGTEPIGGTSTGTFKFIKVTLTGAESALLVNTATFEAINTLYFATPNLIGMFLRGMDPSGTYDLDIGNRYSSNFTVDNTMCGSFEFNQIYLHSHQIIVTGDGVTDSTVGSGGGAAKLPADTTQIGGPEVRPVNMNVKYVIKY